MTNVGRTVGICLISAMLAGCAQYSQMSGINRADDLGLLDPAAMQALPSLPPLPPVLVPTDSNDPQYRSRFAEQWMARSDVLCRQYKDKLMMVSRDARFTTNVAQLILSGVATLVTPLSTAHALAGAATAVGGVGAEFDADFFQKQSGEILASAIQTARENQANQIEMNLAKFTPEEYSIYRVERDVTEYHNMCSLETGLSQIRTALRVTSPDAGASPPAAQGAQTNTVQAAIAADAGNRAAAGAAAGAAAAQARGIPPATGAALGAVAGANAAGGAQKAAEAGAAAVRPTPPPSSSRPGRASPPSSPDRPAFIAAIKKLPLQNGVLTQSGRKLVDTCAAPFGIAPGMPVADISRGAGTNLNAITDCINKGRGGL